MSYAAAINYWLQAQGYSGNGVQLLPSRFIMTDNERAAARRDANIHTMEHVGYDVASIRRAADTSCDI